MFFAGAITGASGSTTNAWTGPSGLGFFAIPPGTKQLWLQPSASGVRFELGIATGISFQTTLARAALLQDAKMAGPFRIPPTQNACVVAVYNNTGATVSVQVYASPV